MSVKKWDGLGWNAFRHRSKQSLIVLANEVHMWQFDLLEMTAKSPSNHTYHLKKDRIQCILFIDSIKKTS